VTDDLLEAIGLSLKPSNLYGWNPVPSFFSFYEIWSHTFYFLAVDQYLDFCRYFFHLQKFYLGFHTGLKFLLRELLHSLDLMPLKFGRKKFSTAKFWFGKYVWPNFAL
jgi:hypothetical protein